MRHIFATLFNLI